MRGSEGPEVATWQRILDLQAPAVGRIAVDGMFGPQTGTATIEFQRRAHFGLRPDGIVDLQTRKAWLSANLTMGADRTVLSRSSGISPDIGYLQISLNRWLARHAPSVEPLWVDGIFGPKTEAATRLLQSTVDIPEDGIAGPRTWSALQSRNMTHFP